jgi:hypothetical protein
LKQAARSLRLTVSGIKAEVALHPAGSAYSPSPRFAALAIAAKSPMTFLRASKARAGWRAHRLRNLRCGRTTRSCERERSQLRDLQRTSGNALPEHLRPSRARGCGVSPPHHQGLSRHLGLPAVLHRSRVAAQRVQSDQLLCVCGGGKDRLVWDLLLPRGSMNVRTNAS